MKAYPELFAPYTFCGLELQNRFVQTPLQTRAGDEQGFVSGQLLDYHAARRATAPGLVIAQQTFAWPEVKLARGLALWDDVYIEPMRALAQTIKAGGSKAFLQLGGAGSRREGAETAPSPVAGSWNLKKPREMTLDEMRHYRDLYAQAGKRLEQCGFDGFSLQGTGGKFLAQFLSPHSNRRTDAYGGSPARRVRYFLEVIDAIRQSMSARLPMIMRFDCSDFMEGGLSVEEGLEQAALLLEGGVDALLLGAGGQERLWLGVPSSMAEAAPLRQIARRYKKELPRAVIILGGKVHDPDIAESILEEKDADLIAVMRPLLADAAYIDKIRQGKPERIHHCVGCLNCQTWEKRPHFSGRPVACTVNPGAFDEGSPLTPAARPKRILVAGGGLAGMQAALLLAKRGHRVALHEKRDALGGQWRIAASPAGHSDYRNLPLWLEREMREAGVDITLNSPVDRALAERLQPEIIIAATGARPRPLPGELLLPGAMPVFSGFDVLQGKVNTGERVVVVGGRYIGMEAACLLAEQGRQVALVEMDDIGSGTILRLRGFMFQRLVAAGVQLYPRATLFRVTSDTVEAAHNGTLFLLPADAVVSAIGTVPDNSLAESLQSGPWQLHSLGDCKGIGDALEAMLAGYNLGKTLE